jgi:hypothetical protein
MSPLRLNAVLRRAAKGRAVSSARIRAADHLPAATAPNASLPVIEQVALATLAGDTLKNLAVCHRVAMSGDLDGIPLLMFFPPIAPCPRRLPDKSQ